MDTENLNKFLKEFQKETDRATAILGVCYLDKTIENLLTKFFIPNSKFIEKYIIGNSLTTAIDTFSKKIRLAYGLGLLREEEYNDLEIIRDIRNDFAHKLHGLSFETQSIKDKSFNLKIAQATIGGPLLKAKFKDSSLFRYKLSVVVIGNFIDHRAKYDIKNREIWSVPLL